MQSQTEVTGSTAQRGNDPNWGDIFLKAGLAAASLYCKMFVLVLKVAQANGTRGRTYSYL